MQPGTWPNPPHADEYSVRFDAGRARRLLIVPALFDEANKLRHFTVEVMRQLDTAGVDSMMPDLPGTNESLAGLPAHSLDSWRGAMANAATHFAATHVISLRAGHLCVPEGLPHLAYAPAPGASVLRIMLRARMLTDREAGFRISENALLSAGKREGLRLAGHDLGPIMISDLSGDRDHPAALDTISQNEIGGRALWLRAEPSHDAEQAVALAKAITEWIA